MNNKNYEKLADCMTLKEGGSIRCKKCLDRYGKDDKCTLHMIGFNKNSDILNVCGYDWTIIKLSREGNFEMVGKSDYSLASIKDNPKILLQDAKVMSIKQIEKQLGYNIIIRESERR